MPENQRKVVGLQATAREWRRKECFKIISDHTDKLALFEEIDANTPGSPNLLRDTPQSVDIRQERRTAVFATAHHADDQQETILLKFLRGAHISNLQPVCQFNLMAVILYMFFFMTGRLDSNFP